MRYPINRTHSYGVVMEDLTPDEIRACPTYQQGIAPEDFASGKFWVPPAVLDRIMALPWSNERKYRWLYVRSQECKVDAADTRSGAFWHFDVDAIYKCVAPAWDEFRELIVSFGDISEPEFAEEQIELELPSKPTSNDYVALSGQLHRPWRSSSPQNCQVVSYRTLDCHRAGRIRRSGWRLVMVGFETDAPPKENWP